MSESFTFELIDGVKDDKGQLQKTVVMRQMTMADQIKIKENDATAAKLLTSNYSLGSKNQVERMFALTEFNQYYIILFKQTVLSIGTMDQKYLRDNDMFAKMTSRDIGLMIAWQNGSDGRMVRLDTILEIIDSIKLADGIRAQFMTKIDEALGETKAAAAD